MDTDGVKNDGSSKSSKGPWYAINKDYLPLKLMYFFFMAGQACSIVYRSIFMRHLGLSTNQTGMIWMIERTMAMVLPYLIGSFTDKTQKPKAVLLVLLIGGAINISSMYFIPPEPYIKSDLGRNVSWKEISRGETSFCWNVICNNSSHCSVSNPKTSSKSCHSNTAEISSLQCQTVLSTVLNLTSLQEVNDTASITATTIPTTLFQSCVDSMFSKPISTSTWLAAQPAQVSKLTISSLPNAVPYYSPPFINISRNFYYAYGTSHPGYLCYEADSGDKTEASCDEFIPNPVDEYGVTFWLVTIMVSVSCFTGVGIYPVLEATTFEVLGKENRGKYGHQRLWASVGYGITAVLIGYVKDESTTPNDGRTVNNREFLPMFIGVLICWICAAIVSFKLPIKSEKSPRKVRLTDIKTVLMNPRAIAFYGVLLFYGMMNTIHQIYLFWLAEEKLNSPSFVLGIATMIGSFMDIPFCLSAGFLIKKFGHIPLFCFGVIVYAVRVSSAALVVDAWQLLATESLRGITWGLTWVVICSYTTKISPKGLEHSTMGITQSLVRGVASSIGALLGGVIYQAKGGEFLFFSCSLVSVIAVVMFAIFILCTRKASSKRDDPQRGDVSERLSMKVNAENPN